MGRACLAMRAHTLCNARALGSVRLRASICSVAVLCAMALTAAATPPNRLPPGFPRACRHRPQLFRALVALLSLQLGQGGGLVKWVLGSEGLGE